jgi:hypothetical protein
MKAERIYMSMVARDRRSFLLNPAPGERSNGRSPPVETVTRDDHRTVKSTILGQFVIDVIRVAGNCDLHAFITSKSITLWEFGGRACLHGRELVEMLVALRGTW